MGEDALEALCNALDVIDDRLRRCEQECRVAWTACEEARKTVEYLTQFRLAVREIAKTDERQGGT